MQCYDDCDNDIVDVLNFKGLLIFRVALEEILDSTYTINDIANIILFFSVVNYDLGNHLIW